MRSVSYTHLDVYKRQQPHHSAGMRRTLDDAIFARIDGIIAIGKEDSLDVLNRFRFGIVGTKSHRAPEPVGSGDTADANQ